MRFVLALAVACSGLGCGGTGGSSPMDMAGGGRADLGGESGGCTYTLSGAVSQSGSCKATAAYDTASNTTPGLGIEINGGSLNFGSELSATDNFADGNSYTAANVVNAASATVMGTEAWSLSIHDQNAADQGTFTLHISSTGPAVTDGSGNKAWLASHGTLDLTMPTTPGSTGSGTVTGHVTF